MKAILRLIEKEYRLFLSDRVAVALTFIVPFLLTMVWGAVFGNVDRGPQKIALGFVNESPSPVARHLEKVLDTTRAFRLVRTTLDGEGRTVKFDTASVKTYVMSGRASAALVIPADAYTDTSLGLKLRLYYDPKNDMEMQLIQGLLQKTVFSQLPTIFTEGMQRQALRFLGVDSGRAFNRGVAGLVSRFFNVDTSFILRPFRSGADSTVAGAQAGDFFSGIMNFEQVQVVGKDVANPWATRSVGGWAMMFLLFTLTASASSLFDEKKSGVVLRILASPVSRGDILWSKYLFNVSLGLLQLTVLLTSGSLLYGIDILSNIGNLILVATAAATACTAFGMLLAAFTTTSAQANGLGMFLILTMSSIGGAWFPVSFMPEFVQFFSKGTIVYWAMEAFLHVLWRGAGIITILPHLGILLGFAALLTTVSLIRFKKGHVF